MYKMKMYAIAILFIASIFYFTFPPSVSAHCDTIDGPVVSAARKSLDTGNPNYILIWVKPENEDDIRKLLRKILEKRRKSKSKDETDKADMELFQELVRIHREGEGATYEGVKPAGEIEPEIMLADSAIENGSISAVISKIHNQEDKETIQNLFDLVLQKSKYHIDDVQAGREYVESYVTFIHSVEKALKGERILEGHHHHN